MFVPDSEAKECQICERAFTTIIRRHHCRFCGKLVCGACSKERLGDDFTGEALRACTPCHEAAQADYKYENELKESNQVLFEKMKRQQEQMELTKKTIKLLVDPEGLPLIQKPDRIFLHKGELTKVCKNRNKAYNFFLFSDMLCYGEPNGDQTKIRTFLPINAVFDIKDGGGDSRYPANSFAIKSSIKSFVVLSDDEKCKESWLTKLVQAKKDRIRSLKDSGLDIGYGQAAPIYTPDHFCPYCELCAKTFTFTRRRHHCRLCGILVCDGCSKQRMKNYRATSPSKTPRKEKDKQVRVCDKCVKEIEIQKSLRLVLSIPFFHKNYTKEKYWTRLKAGSKGIGSFFITADNMDPTFTEYLLVVWPKEGTICREIPFKIYKDKTGQEVIHSADGNDIKANTWDSFFTLIELDMSLGLKQVIMMS